MEKGEDELMAAGGEENLGWKKRPQKSPTGVERSVSVTAGFRAGNRP